jgi:hypothetical protein
MTKLCSVCEEEKSVEEYPFKDKEKRYRSTKCKTCIAEYQKTYKEKDPEELRQKWKKASQKYYTTDKRRNKTLRNYGLTEDTYNAMFDAQEGKCKICDKDIVLVVDHCHKTEKVRGLLCNSCNVGLGCFEDKVPLMIKAIEYLGAA